MLLLAGAMTASRGLHAQQKAIPLVGYLNSTAPGPNAPLLTGFREGLKETGFIEGKNVAIEYRWAEGRYDRLPVLAADLVGRRVDVIATSGGDLSAVAAKAATPTIPIVSVIGGDPIAAGLVTSLARPGGNLTGVSFLTAELMAKRLQLLLELVPQVQIVALLANPNNPQTGGVIAAVQQAVRTKGVQLQILKAANKDQIDAAFVLLAQHHARALLVQADPFYISRHEQILALTSRHAIPAIYEWRGFPAAGGLISYGADLSDVYRQVGAYVGRILKGTKPADLPVVQPTRFELVINLKAAKALGLKVPPLILARADKIIE